MRSAMTKVCHMTCVHPNNDVRIFVKECCSLVQAGYDVTLIAPGNSLERKGVRIVGIGELPSSRLQRMRYSANTVFNKAVLINADIYHFHDPELLPYGLKLKKMGKCVIYDVHEDYILNIMSKDWIPKCLRSLISYIIGKYEERIVPHLDAVISVTPQIVRRFKDVNVNAVLITNYPIVEDNIMSNDVNYKNRKRQICYAGTISPLRMHHNIISALEQVEDVRYVLAGTNNAYLESLIKNLASPKVNYLGRLSYEDVLALYNNSRVGIVLEDYGLINYNKEGSLGVTKLFEYMMVQLPLICTDFTLHKAIIDKYQCGICINPNDINAIVNAIQYLMNNPELALEMGRNGRKAILSEYNWCMEEKKLLNLYKDLVSNLLREDSGKGKRDL